MARSVKGKKDSSPDPVDALFDLPEATVSPGGSPDDPSPGIFGTAGDQQGAGEFPPLPNMKRGFEAIVERVFDEGIDVLKEYEEIERALSIDGPLVPGSIQAAANATEKTANRAFRLYVIAKVEYESYVRDTEAIIGAIREAATAKLEKEKAAKVRTKMITDADVVATAAQLYPDEWQRVNDRRNRAKGMLDQVNNLAALAKSRCFTVSNMLSPGGKV